MEYSPKKMKELLDKHGFFLKKKFGQNFIIDENIIVSIINKSGVDKDTLVIEIGPGAGSLTYKLALSAGNVVCYEIDTTLQSLLQENMQDCKNIEVIYQDFLLADVNSAIKKYNYNKIFVVANLPYYITTPIIVKIIEDSIPVDKMVVMVQKEVGDRFKAVPGNKDYGSLSVFLNYYFDIKKLMDVSCNVFLPKPNVDSIVVEFRKKDILPELKDKQLFFKLIKDSFAQKRKNIRNNLKQYDLSIVEAVLKEYNYDLNVRAEQLSLDIFVNLANSLSDK